MSEILDRAGIESRIQEMLKEIRAGKIFVYPTDTIYGIGCDATRGASVKRIRAMKQRDSKPFSVVAPSREWINRNCIVNPKAKEWLEKLPGPYTFILKLSKSGAISTEVNGGLGTIGVRIPDNWFAKVIARAAIPFVTTSVNLSGKPHMASIDEIEPSIARSVDYIIDAGPLNNRPSRVVDLAGGGKTVRD